MIDRLKAIGVDEVACLIDFGIDFDSVISSLHHLETLRELSNPNSGNVKVESMFCERLVHLTRRNSHGY